MVRSLAIAAVASLAPACRELPALEAGVCGNGVIDSDEDCDGATDPALGTDLACAPATEFAACRYTCDASACPLGWACGDDGLCRHGTGAFVLGSVVALPHDELAIADADGDGTGDVVGFHASGARVAFGDVAVVAASPDQITGPGAATDLDADGRADVVVPFGLGLGVARGEIDHTLTPVGYAPFASSPDSWFLPTRAPGAEPGDALVSLVPDGFGGTRLDLVLVPSGETQLSVPFVSGIGPQHFGPDAPRADLDAPSAEDELVIAAPGYATAWVVRPEPSAVAGRLETAAYPIALGAASDGRVALADLDGDGDLDLVLGTTRPTGFGVVTAVNAGAFPGWLATAAPDARFAPLALPQPGDTSAPRLFPLALGDLDADGDVDAVSPDAVFATIGGVLQPVYQRATSAPWREAVIADVDDDEIPDVVVTSHGPGLDVLRQAAGGFEGPVAEQGGFTRVAIGVAGQATMLRAGDFDGDHLGDVAFRERRGSGDRIRVLFGAVGPFASPLAATGAPSIGRFEAGRFRNYDESLDQAADLVSVVRDGAAGRLGFVDGVGDRRLRSPLFLVRDRTLFDVPLAVVPLQLVAGDALPGLAVLAFDRANERRVLWVFPGAAGAAYDTAAASNVVDPGAFATLELVRFAAADLDGDGRDEVIGLGVMPPAGDAIVVALDLHHGLAERVIAPGVGAPLDLAAGDLDGDGTAELVIAGTLGVAVWRAGAVIATPHSATALCVAQLDADAALELAMLEAGEVLVVDGRDPAAPPTAFAAPPGATVIRAGDVDGDGVADLVFGDGLAVTPLRSVPQLPQVPR